jgi:hypothetical protein
MKKRGGKRSGAGRPKAESDDRASESIDDAPEA